ncbi:hypothetical protein CC86DRAFT_304384, partial [Ophiobolus disseminans]
GRTSKIYVVRIILAKIKQLAKQYSIAREIIQRSALTRVAAYNINGRTLHSLFYLPVKTKTYKPLT